jgi:hypothetical protein
MIKLGVAALLVFNLNTSWALETLLFGGGGEPGGNDTIFDSALEVLADNKDNVDLNIRSSFNGGHMKTETILREKLKIENQEFTPDNWQKAVSEYIVKIKSGQMKKGENLLVLVDTHGQEADSKNSTHMIDMAIKGKNRGGRQASMDMLKELAQVASDKGINLGIVDFSCHSGNSLSLGNDKTCVVTAAAPNLYGYDDFTKSFYTNMKKGMSLEDVYLKARKDAYSPSFPMISTKENESLKDSLYTKLYPYMTYAGGLANKLSPYLDQVINSEALQCKRENDFNILVKQIEDFEKVNGAIKSKYGEAGQLLGELKKYKSKQDDMLNEMKRTNYKLLATKEKVVLNPKSKKAIMISWDEAMRFNESNYQYFLDQLKNADRNTNKAEVNETLARMSAARKIKERLAVEHPELNEALTFTRRLSERNQELVSDASKVHELAAQLYDQTYKAKRGVNDTPDACKAFVF